MTQVLLSVKCKAAAVSRGQSPVSTVSGPGRPAAAAIDACKKLASRKLKLGFLNFDIDICVVITFRAKGVPIHCTLCSKFPEFPEACPDTFAFGGFSADKISKSHPNLRIYLNKLSQPELGMLVLKTDGDGFEFEDLC